MGRCSWKSVRKKMARKVAEKLGLEEDLVVNEIRTAETKQEAIDRLINVKRDAEIALDMVIRGRCR